MSGVQPFQFEPTYPPDEEPTESESEWEEESEGAEELSNFTARVGNMHRMVSLWWKLCSHVDGG